MDTTCNNGENKGLNKSNTNKKDENQYRRYHCIMFYILVVNLIMFSLTETMGWYVGLETCYPFARSCYIQLYYKKYRKVYIKIRQIAIPSYKSF